MHKYLTFIFLNLIFSTSVFTFFEDYKNFKEVYDLEDEEKCIEILENSYNKDFLKELETDLFIADEGTLGYKLHNFLLYLKAIKQNNLELFFLKTKKFPEFRNFLGLKKLEKIHKNLKDLVLANPNNIELKNELELTSKRICEIHYNEIINDQIFYATKAGQELCKYALKFIKTDEELLVENIYAVWIEKNPDALINIVNYALKIYEIDPSLAIIESSVLLKLLLLIIKDSWPIDYSGLKKSIERKIYNNENKKLIITSSKKLNKKNENENDFIKKKKKAKSSGDYLLKKDMHDALNEVKKIRSLEEIKRKSKKDKSKYYSPQIPKENEFAKIINEEDIKTIEKITMRLDKVLTLELRKALESVMFIKRKKDLEDLKNVLNNFLPQRDLSEENKKDLSSLLEIIDRYLFSKENRNLKSTHSTRNLNIKKMDFIVNNKPKSCGDSLKLREDIDDALKMYSFKKSEGKSKKDNLQYYSPQVRKEKEIEEKDIKVIKNIKISLSDLLQVFPELDIAFNAVIEKRRKEDLNNLNNIFNDKSPIEGLTDENKEDLSILFEIFLRYEPKDTLYSSV